MDSSWIVFGAIALGIILGGTLSQWEWRAFKKAGQAKGRSETEIHRRWLEAATKGGLW
jgi:hypothetical protein